MVTAGITLSSLLVILGIWAHSFSLIPDLFRLNKECQEEGYYMAEFEFKMLGFAYDLDKGQYEKAVSSIRKYHKQLKARQGLIKLPAFTDKKQEMDFYLNLQNPKTGAFMDDAAPYCTYEGPTGNVLLLLDALAKETGQPMQLKYPLTFFDAINTPEKLTAYLDDLANIGWLAAKLPESSFHMVRDLAGYSRDDDIVNKYHLYTFSPEWKQALLKWLYDNQDPQTGFWGPRSRFSGKLLKLDLHNTGSIVKAFVDNNGNDRHVLFPLRYKDKMFANTLLVMAEPPPDISDLDEWHGWTLRTGKGVSLLTRYLWKGVSRENKEKARKSFETFVRVRFEKYYLSDQGAFCYYPGSLQATLDGTGSAMGFFENIGAFVPEKQRRLWGGVEETCVDLGSFSIKTLTEKDFDPIMAQGAINSVRFYSGSPDSMNFMAKVQNIWYPRNTQMLDIVDLVPRVKNWVNTTTQSMGNWTSREETEADLADVKIEPVSVSKGDVPLEKLAELLRVHKTVTVIGFDVLQIPRCKMVFRLSDS